MCVPPHCPAEAAVLRAILACFVDDPDDAHLAPSPAAPAAPYSKVTSPERGRTDAGEAGELVLVLERCPQRAQVGVDLGDEVAGALSCVKIHQARSRARRRRRSRSPRSLVYLGAVAPASMMVWSRPMGIAEVPRGLVPGPPSAPRPRSPDAACSSKWTWLRPSAFIDLGPGKRSAESPPARSEAVARRSDRAVRRGDLPRSAPSTSRTKRVGSSPRAARRGCRRRWTSGACPCTARLSIASYWWSPGDPDALHPRTPASARVCTSRPGGVEAHVVQGQPAAGFGVGHLSEVSAQAGHGWSRPGIADMVGALLGGLYGPK